MADLFAVILMGVSGCGKTTVGKALAAHLGWPFYDGDDFHPPANVEKMRQGRPLTDADRAPWLDALREVLETHLAQGQPLILACSALKRQYRDHLRAGKPEQVRFVFLAAEYAVIFQRMQTRPAHYMRPAMLASQFADLEPPGPAEALHVDASQPLEDILAEIRAALFS